MTSCSVSPEGAWARRPLAVLSLPFIEATARSTPARRAAASSRSGRLASSSPRRRRLGIGGKLWDAALAVTAASSGARGTDGRVHGKRVLELGSGVGAVGIGARLFGASRVVLTDIEDVVPLLEANIELNHVENVTAVALDWFQAVPSAILDESFDLVGADVAYDPDLHAPLLKTLGVLLDRVPVCLLAHRRRNPHDADFFGALRRASTSRRVVSTGAGAGCSVPAIVIFLLACGGRLFVSILLEAGSRLGTRAALQLRAHGTKEIGAVLFVIHPFCSFSSRAAAASSCAVPRLLQVALECPSLGFGIPRFHMFF